MAKCAEMGEDHMNALLARSHAGDQEAIAEARAFLNDSPERWDRIGQLAALAVSSWIDATVGEKHEIAREAVRRHLAKLKDDLTAGRQVDPLERLLIHRVQLTWLQLYSAETMYGQQLQNGMTLTLQQHYEMRLNMAQRRHLAAIRTLATVRRLLAPAAPLVHVDQAGQVNVAQEQVNGTGPVVSMDGYRRLQGGA
jgi:hypothetical protein